MPLAEKVKRSLTAVMNRLVATIERRSRPVANFPKPLSGAVAPMVESDAGWLKDAKLFGAGYLAGIAVFGTFLA